LWSVLGGGGRESPVKHGARGASRGGASTGGGGGTGEEGPGEGGSDEVGGTSEGKLNGCIMHQVHTSTIEAF